MCYRRGMQTPLHHPISDPSLAPADPAGEPDYARRFGGVARLFGQAAVERFRRAHVCVVGVGGVGSWTVEALARSGVGHLTLIDLDHVSESNMNRQIQALDATLGQAKVSALAERIAQINPACQVRAVDEFVDEKNVGQLLGVPGLDFVVDASDQVVAKVAMAAFCRAQGLPLVTVGGAGGQRDATRVRVVDLAHTEHEALLARVRKRLRNEHGFPRNLKAKFGIGAVFSDEPAQNPWNGAGAPDGDDSAARSGGLNCAGFGSCVAVTAVFGMVAAGHVLERLAAGAPPPLRPPVSRGA